MFIALIVALLVQDPTPDCGKEGAFKIAVLKTKIPRKAGDAAAEIHYPSEEKGPFATVVLSPGGNAPSTSGYDIFGKQWASWGFVTVIVAFNNKSADIRGAEYSEVLDWLETRNAEEGWELKGKIDTKKFVAAGHSRGGHATVVAAKKEKRFIAAIPMAPAGPTKVAGDNAPAMCFITGDQGDEVRATALYNQCGKPRFLVTISGMDHFFNPAEKPPLILKYSTAFLLHVVNKDKRYAAILKGEDGVTVASEE